MKTQNIAKDLQEIKSMISEQSTKPLSFDEAAEYLHLSKSCLYKMTSSNKIPYFKPGGKKIFFLQTDLNSYILKNRVKPESEIDEEADKFIQKGKLS